MSYRKFGFNFIYTDRSFAAPRLWQQSHSILRACIDVVLGEISGLASQGREDKRRGDWERGGSKKSCTSEEDVIDAESEGDVTFISLAMHIYTLST